MASQVSQSPEGSQAPSTADLIDRLSRFDGPPELFLVNLLAVQCHLAPADGGAVLRAAGPAGQPEVLAVYPPLAEGATLPAWVAQAAEATPEVVAAGETITKATFGAEDMYGQAARRHLIMVPLRGGQGVRGMTAFTVGTGDPHALEVSRERLEITVSLLSLYEMRLTLQQRHFDFQRLRMAMETLSAVNEHNRFAGAAMAVCNEVSARWQTERVSLGFLKGRYVQVKAMSHTEKFSRKMKLVQDIEGAMEECLDQDVEILHPATPQETYANRAAGELSKHHGPSAVLSLPLRRAGDVMAVLTVERPPEQPFELEEIESLRLTGELCTARLAGLYETDRWFGARIAASLRKGIAGVLGPKHTWIKVAAILILGIIVFLTFAKGQYRVQSPFVLEAIQRRVAPAPFDGHLESVAVDLGDSVVKGQLLGRLRTTELKLQLTAAKAERINHETNMKAAIHENKRIEELDARAKLEGIQAQIENLTRKISQAELLAPCDGRVLPAELGDLKRLIGTPVEKGKPLLWVAPLDALRGELSVPEDQIADVILAVALAKKEGRQVAGELATASEPDLHIPFVVERIIPVAEVDEQQNIFKVRVKLTGEDPAGLHSWMRPGMEGIGKIDIDRRRYAWIWTRKLANWLRMKLWF